MKRFLILSFLICFAASAMAYDGRDMTASLNMGAIFPMEGNVSGVDTEIGFTIGGDFHYYLNDNIGVGSFLVYNGMPLEEYQQGGNSTDTLFSSLILGISASLRYPMERIDLFLTGGVGVAFNEVEQTWEVGNVDYKSRDDAFDFAARVETGLRYYITDMISLGGTISYIYNEMDTKQLDDVDLSAFTTAVSVGFSF